MKFRLGLGALFVSAATATLAAGDHPLIARFPDDRPNCYRADEARLAGDTVTSMLLEHYPGLVEAMPGEFSVRMQMRLRDEDGTWTVYAHCGPGADPVTCTMDCDGGSFELAPNAAGGVELRSRGFVVYICGGHKPNKTLAIPEQKPGEAYTLVRLPGESCRTPTEEEYWRAALEAEENND